MTQTLTDLEVIVVDNNRREPPIVEQAAFAGRLADSRVRVVRALNSTNAAMARNAGLAAASSAWVTYLDDDDAYRPGKLEAQLAAAQAGRHVLVLCGATFHLKGRVRDVQCDATGWGGDDLLLRARWNTPLLFHQHPGALRFDDQLSPGEDAEFAHRLLARAGAVRVGVVSQPLVDIYPQPGPRVNSNPKPLRAAAARILALRPRFYSRAARRRFILQNALGYAKLTRQSGRCLALGWCLLRESRGADWRPCANALAMSLNLFPGRWVS